MCVSADPQREGSPFSTVAWTLMAVIAWAHRDTLGLGRPNTFP